MKDENITITELCKKIALSDPGARKNIENNKQDYLKQGYIVINQVMKQGQSIEQIRVTNKGIDYFMSKYPFIKLSQADIRKLETKQDETKSDKEAVKNSQYVELLEKTITDLKEENKIKLDSNLWVIIWTIVAQIVVIVANYFFSKLFKRGQTEE